MNNHFINTAINFTKHLKINNTGNEVNELNKSMFLKQVNINKLIEIVKKMKTKEPATWMEHLIFC